MAQAIVRVACMLVMLATLFGAVVIPAARNLASIGDRITLATVRR